MSEKTTKKLCFAVTPIGEEGGEIRLRSDQVLRRIIEPVVSDLGYETVRADHISQPGMITNQVIEHLIDDELVVADLTDNNPNVFYELAIRHATRKPVVTIIEAGERIPFDTSQSRTIQVDHRDLDSASRCKQELKRQVLALEENPASFYNPVSVAIDLKMMRESDNPEEQHNAQVLSTLQQVQAEINRLGAEVARLSSVTASGSSPRIVHGQLFPPGFSSLGAEIDTLKVGEMALRDKDRSDLNVRMAELIDLQARVDTAWQRLQEEQNKLMTDEQMHER